MMARDRCSLEIRQQPQRAQVVQESNPKNRKPVDPPPIIELKYDDSNDPANSQWLVSPKTFMMVTLISVDEGEDPVISKLLIGSTVSSLHRLKDHTNNDGGFFVFGDISVKKLGTYKLRFSLFDASKESDEISFMCSVDSQKFVVLAQRDFGSMLESSYLTRTFSDQGVKLRVRKDNRSKRSYNASPPDTTSPSNLPNAYGGAVQDHHYGRSVHSPVVKRQRSGSEYDGTQLYHSMPAGDNHLVQSFNSLPSGTRAWNDSMSHRTQSGYGQQQSPMGMSMIGGGGRVQPMGLQSTPTWSNIHHHQPSQSALPSPTPSVSNQQQPSYPSTTSQQQSSAIFGDPGAVSSIPRNYHSNGYQYTGQDGTYSQGLESSLSDTNGLGATSNTAAYSQGYLPSNGGIYATEGSEVPGAYAYMNDTGSRNGMY